MAMGMVTGIILPMGMATAMATAANTSTKNHADVGIGEALKNYLNLSRLLD